MRGGETNDPRETYAYWLEYEYALFQTGRQKKEVICMGMTEQEANTIEHITRPGTRWPVAMERIGKNGWTEFASLERATDGGYFLHFRDVMGDETGSPMHFRDWRSLLATGWVYAPGTVAY
jgi:hypothetical protein